MESYHILAIVILSIAVVVGVILMPVISGVGTYKANPEYLRKKAEREEEETDIDFRNGKSSSHQYQGYTYEAPDAKFADDENEGDSVKRESGLKKRISKLKNLTTSDIPIKLSLNGDEIEQRYTSEGPVQINNNPNDYDYDLDEFIEKEHEIDMANRAFNR